MYLHVSHRHNGAELRLCDRAGFGQQALQEYFQSPSWSLQVRGVKLFLHLQKKTCPKGLKPSKIVTENTFPRLQGHISVNHVK